MVFFLVPVIVTLFWLNVLFSYFLMFCVMEIVRAVEPQLTEL